MRSLTSAVQSATVAEHYIEVLFAKLEFSAGTVYACSAGYTITMSGQSWLGMANIGSVEPIGEGLDLSSTYLRFTLSGVNPAHVSNALGQQYQGLPATAWTAFLDSNYQIIASPDIAFKGRMDTMDISIGDTATISVTAEHFLADRDRPRVRRFNHSDMQAVHSGDMFFEYIETLATKEFKWGRQT